MFILRSAKTAAFCGLFLLCAFSTGTRHGSVLLNLLDERVPAPECVQEVKIVNPLITEFHGPGGDVDCCV
jgi:hypothetical protein